MNNSIFITATSTNIGKTVVSAIICNILTKKYKRINYYKPVQTGCYKQNDKLIAPDIEFVKSVNHNSIEYYSTYLFEPPCSPHLASRLENRKIYLTKIIKDYEKLKKENEYIIIEGAGGIFVPIDEKKFFIYHIPLKLNIPVVLVSNACLGAINQVGLSYKFLKILNIKIAAVILLYEEEEPNYIEIDNCNILKKILNFENIYLLPKVKNCDTEKFITGNIFDVIKRYPDITTIESWFHI